MFIHTNASGSQRMTLIGIELAELLIVKNGLARFRSGVLKSLLKCLLTQKR
jgi:hypothetical protein